MAGREYWRLTPPRPQTSGDCAAERGCPTRVANVRDGRSSVFWLDARVERPYSIDFINTVGLPDWAGLA